MFEWRSSVKQSRLKSFRTG